MKVLIDTSVLIAGMLSDHRQHSHAQPWLARAKAGAFEAVVSGHSVAELYAVLTRLPRTPRITPAEAWQLIQTNVVSQTVVTLSAHDYVKMIEELVQVSVVGGAVYDAVIAKAAELANVDHLLTFNPVFRGRLFANNIIPYHSNGTSYHNQAAPFIKHV